ncbi:phytanoyl-CoA dioxygenase family protein [Flavobacterium chilense]|uniref:Phytanoyl-CoA dioxygenase (PhyH) n=1 Tax=Flavobacterium chilense TaxID=946677 RepID=A0A1M6ZN04_9FLAO|nr:phytanoyl-CoA dioxygenase family protein [Flavobacterium chilense]SHL31784.1 Phytanoyl-CoA dioxygenase (PhyH) [Flavobacterium chilense]
MPWTILEKLWTRTLHPSNVAVTNDTQTWNAEIKALYQLGIGMEETLQFLYFEKPDFENFKIWINNRQRNQTTETEILTEDVLSEEDLQFWNKNGYIVIKDAISKEDCKATEQAIWDYLKMDPDKKETWYQRHEDQKGLMLNFSDHETLNRNRLSPKIKKAYEQLYKTTNLYKTIDKVSFNPPETEEFSFLGSLLHWDISIKPPFAFGLQGLLYLTDCDANDGAFHCVPGFHNKIEEWIESIPADQNPRDLAVETLQSEPIIGNAGDFIIWNNTLPHCATPNKGKTPRMVQYLTYLPNENNTFGEWA